MNNLRKRSLVPRRVLTLALCWWVAGTSYGANLCADRNGSSGAVATLETRLADVPALLRVPPKVSKPPILLWHGFGPPASERALMEALPLDDVPAIKV
jgi:hypothetical protein